MAIESNTAKQVRHLTMSATRNLQAKKRHAMRKHKKSYAQIDFGYAAGRSSFSGLDTAFETYREASSRTSRPHLTDAPPL
jgi:hypothetical protein